MRTQTYYHTRFQDDANRKSDTVSLQVNCTGVVGQDSRFSTRSVRQDYYYIYVLEGRMVMADFDLVPGDVMVLEPGYHYQYRAEGETTYLWVHYTGFDALAITRSAQLHPNVKHHIGVHEELIDCFKRLFREFMINDEASGMLSVCILREILMLTGRYADTHEKNRIPLAAIEYIHRHYREEIDVDMLAQMEHKSATSLRTAFKEHTGVSPNEYIITQRMSEACRLLSQTDRSISSIASDVGYGDQYYFSRIFKKKIGTAPLKYRFLNRS